MVRSGAAGEGIERSGKQLEKYFSVGFRLDAVNRPKASVEIIGKSALL